MMRIIVVDSDVAFTQSVEQRYKKLGVYCQTFPSPKKAFEEIKKSPDTVDLVLVTRELFNNQDGLVLVQNLRKDPHTADVPYIIISSVWGKSEFAKHQKSEFGANAYFNKKSPLPDLDVTIEAVTGYRFQAAAEKEKSKQTRMATNLSTPSLSGIQLQPANDVVNIAEEVPDDISLEQPIQLFDSLGSSNEEVSAPVVAQPTSVKAELPTPAPSPASDGIEISISEVPQSSVAVEHSGVAQVHAQPKAQTIEPPSVLALEVEPSKIQVEAPAPTPTPVPVDAVAPVAAEAPVTESTGTGTQSAVSEEEAARDLPYLFTGPSATVGAVTKSMMAPGAMMPQTSANAPDLGLPPTVVSDDVETLKRYLTMREQDVAVLTTQLTYAKEELLKGEDTIKRLSLQTEDLIHQVADLKKRVTDQEQELQHAGKSMEGEVEQLRQEVKTKIDRIKFLEERLEDSAEQYEKLKERVRLDIRKIRVREKELESKLEILKKDSETLIAARENKILELKRKIDLLEFNYDTLQDKNEQEKRNVQAQHEKVEKIYKILKLAMGVVEAEEGVETSTTPNVKVAS